jgi:hypothetical protein
MKPLLAFFTVIVLTAHALAQYALWQYGTQGTDETLVTFAAAPGITEDGQPVELRFSSSDLAGRQLRIHNLPGALDCATGCRLELMIDDTTSQVVRASFPPELENTLSLRGARDIWRSLTDADELNITYPLEGGSMTTARFTVTGLDPSALPGWD